MKKICVITGSRAEYGLLYNLINSLDVNNNVLKNVVRPYIDSNLQKLVNSENELLKEIPNFLKKISWH